MRKQKNNHNISIYQKWPLPLPDIRCRLEPADILLFPTLAINKGTIFGSINIVQELAKWLKLSDKIIKGKLILLNRDLMTIWNCCNAEVTRPRIT